MKRHPSCLLATCCVPWDDEGRFAEAIFGHVETAQLFASDSIWPTATPIRSTILLRI